MRLPLNTTGVEISFLPILEDGRTGFNFCNLTEINGGACNDKETFFRACKAGAILGTLQAGYTDFKYLTQASQDLARREALLGVSITGWMNNPDVLFDKANMKQGAEIVKEANKLVAKMIGINQAARCTTVKPSGNASVLLNTASGIHGEHSKRYFRHVQMNEQEEVLHLIQAYNPEMAEKSVWSNNGTDSVVAFPIQSPDSSLFKKDLLGVKQLEYVKLAQQNWIEYGTNSELSLDSRLRHNVSNTITVNDWDEVEEYLYNNREWFAGVSLLSSYGDKGYAQAPFTEVFTAQELLDKYKEASMFASGLIVDGLHAFNGNLWSACDTLLGFGENVDEESSDNLLKRDWVRRAKKFSKNYFNRDLEKLTECLKDCYNLHKWEGINRNLVDIDFSSSLTKRTFVDVDTLGAVACSGGSCEIV